MRAVFLYNISGTKKKISNFSTIRNGKREKHGKIPCFGNLCRVCHRTHLCLRHRQKSAEFWRRHPAYEQNFAIYPCGRQRLPEAAIHRCRCVFCLYDRGFVHYGGLKVADLVRALRVPDRRFLLRPVWLRGYAHRQSATWTWAGSCPPLPHTCIHPPRGQHCCRVHQP